MIQKSLSYRTFWSFCFLFLIYPCSLRAQVNHLSIEICFSLAEKNFPMITEYELLNKQIEYSINDVNRGNYPRLYLKGQASYQSEVVKVPLEFPGINIPEVSRDQYKIYGEMIQPLTDLYVISEKKDIIKARGQIEKSRIDIEFYKLKKQVNQLFFSILLSDAQLKQAKLTKDDIQIGIDKVQIAANQGVALKSDIDILRAELLKIEQYIIEIMSNRKGYVRVLELLIKEPIDENTVFEQPLIVPLSSAINRPELRLLESRRKIASIEYKFVGLKNLPRFNLFFRGGYGRPTLNPLKNDFGPYYIGGINFSWNISNLYTRKDEQRQLNITQSIIEIQKETFTLNTNLELAKHRTEIAKYDALIAKDEEIIKIKEKIKKNSQLQLKSGVVTSTDYLINTNAENQARQNKILHQIQLLKIHYDHQLTSGHYKK